MVNEETAFNRQEEQRQAIPGKADEPLTVSSDFGTWHSCSVPAKAGHFMPYLSLARLFSFIILFMIGPKMEK